MYRCNDQIVILTCSGKLGDDEVVCRWKQVQHSVKNVIFCVFFCFLFERFLLYIESMDE